LSLKNEKIHIQVIGIGGGGGKAVNHIAELNKGRTRFIIIDTDQTALNESDIEEKILIGKYLTNGYGAGANPGIAKAAKAAGAMIVAVVTLPFANEGSKRENVAKTNLRSRVFIQKHLRSR